MPALSASARLASGRKAPGLSRMARWKSPAASGEVSSMAIEAEPAEASEGGDPLGVAAERRDVPLHPAEGGDLVEQPVIARSAVRQFTRVRPGWAR